MNSQRSAPRRPRRTQRTASIQKVVNGYRAQVKMLGIRDSRVLPTRREVTEWARVREQEICAAATKLPGEIQTLRQAFEKFAEEESPKRLGTRWELLRVKAFCRTNLPADLPLAAVSATHIAAFRDERLGQVKSSTVLRELTLLSTVFQVGQTDWRWINHNPCRDIRKPTPAQHRERVIR